MVSGEELVDGVRGGVSRWCQGKYEKMCLEIKFTHKRFVI